MWLHDENDQNARRNKKICWFSLTKKFVFVSMTKRFNNYWLHTRALKSSLSVFGTYFQCQGVNAPTSTLRGDHGNVRSSKKPKIIAKYGLHHT